ncbi:MAG TPA: hypothetical protein VIR15_03340 [Intrasporangium sp.]|uniref:hypothetical protein n=1 Tax=Intrasporangium sp. TaxID=1925024 RepID=UPI002F92FB74
MQRWTETDRLLHLALTLYMDGVDSSHGQLRRLAMDPDLADEWTYVEPVRDFASLTMAKAAATKKDSEHPEAWRYVIGLREGWEERKAIKVAERLARLHGDDN